MTTSRKLFSGICLAAGGWLVARSLLRRARSFDYLGKVAVVTGGSRGLGLVLAEKLLRAGAQVAICARDAAEIRRAVKKLEGHGREIIGLACDVREPKDVENFMQRVVQRWGRIDLLFNVAGVIEVGPLDSMTFSDFENAMATHCWGPLHTTMAALPHMRRQQWGRIVNIASLGGKRAVPHMLPYAASKFALVGLSTGLRTELAKDGILVTTICPGLMRTGSPRNATFKAQNTREFTWFSIADSLPLLSMPADVAADKIMQATVRGDAEVVLSGAGSLAAMAQFLAPNLTAELLTGMNHILPRMGGIGRQGLKGSQSSSWPSPSVLTRLSDAAAERNNEVTPL